MRCAICMGHYVHKGNREGERGSVSNFEIRESEPKLFLTRVGGWARMRTREATLVNLGHVGEIYFKQEENHTYNYLFPKSHQLAQLSQPDPKLILYYNYILSQNFKY